MRKIYPLLAVCAAIALACGTTTVIVTPTMDMSAVVAQTLAAYTVQAALSQAAAPTQTQVEAPAQTQMAVPTQPPPARPTPQEVAPNPLPVTHTGIILNNGECFNFDNGQVTAPDGQCDVLLAQPALFRQMNGAQISGYVSFEIPTRSHCAGARYEPGDLAVQTDLYMCLITNQGRIGFVVIRQYRGGVPSAGIVFDYWIFL